MICVFLAEGFEEIEAVTVIDILRREKFDVMVAGVNLNEITGSMGIKIKPDIDVLSVCQKDLQGVVLPGGMPGMENLFKNDDIKKIIKYCWEKNLLIASICAAPSILGRMGILEGKKACCYPGFEKELKGAKIVNEKVVTDGNIITSKGPGTAFDFAICIAEWLSGRPCSGRVRESMQCI